MADSRRDTLRFLFRLAAAYVLLLVMATRAPEPWLRAVAPVAALTADAASPYLDDLRARVEGRAFQFDGRFMIDMTLATGQPVPPIPGAWRQQGSHALHLALVAFSLWAAIALPWRRKIAALGFTAVAALIFSGIDLSVQMLDSALGVIGRDWLPAQVMRSDEANLAAFQRLESHYEWVRGAKAFFDGGGRLFLGVVAGWLGAGLIRPASPDSDLHDKAPY